MATEKHKELATIIKNCHSSLRELTKEHGENEAWQQHLRNATCLNQYAAAMRQLAEIWEENSDKDSSLAYSRIKWAINYCLAYFDAGICLQKRTREQRQLTAWCPNITETDCCLMHAIPPDCICVLDVGSCYNPFKNVQRFEVTALDLSPASPEVLSGDFLHIEVDNIDSPVMMKHGKVHQIKANYFHCVIFSLLLEYMPSSWQRIACCRKAFEALRAEGILIIITPDSQHVGKNAALMKQWRITLAQMGFMRIRFEKLACITCLAFRKSIHDQLPQKWLEQQPAASIQMEIRIPQDD